MCKRHVNQVYSPFFSVPRSPATPPHLAGLGVFLTAPDRILGNGGSTDRLSEAGGNLMNIRLDAHAYVYQ